MMWNWMGGGFGWGVGMVVMAAFWVIVALAIVWIVRTVWDRPGPREASGPRSETPLEILQRRYARGEIDRAEFEEKRRDLS
jgi:putative membrane protein